MTTWDDIAFAAQLEGVSPATIALICVLNDWQRGRIEAIHELLDGLFTSITEAESRLADLNQLHERVGTLERDLAHLRENLRVE